MVRYIVNKHFADGLNYVEAAGLSGDTKPTKGIVTGSRFTEVDTGLEFCFDEENGMWIQKNTGNGKTPITGATVTLGTSPKYDGSQKTQAVSSVTFGGSTLTASTDYEIVGNKGTEVGDYTLKIIGKGSYTGILSKTWSIAKGSGSVSASPDSLTLTEGGDAGESAMTVTGDGEITVATSAAAVAIASVEGTTVTVSPAGEGTATITVTLADGANYEGGTDTISVTVEAASEGE